MNFVDRQDSELKQTKWVGGWVIVWLFSAVEEVADWMLETARLTIDIQESSLH